MVNMSSSYGGVQIACPNCRQPMSVQLEQAVDGGRDPNAKARLISGRLNLFTCPACGFQSRLAAPLLYHDQGKELLILYVPMELGLPKEEQERMIGSMTQAVVNSIPQEQRKGYLFTPKQALTMQGMIEMVLEKDGVSKEMLDARRQKARLIESFLQADPEQWEQMATENDALLDREFFEVITASADAAVANGRRDVAEHLLGLREALLDATTVGRELLAASEQQEVAIQEVAKALNTLGDQVTMEKVVDLALEFGAQGEDRLQALVGLARPVLNYEFFSALSKRLEGATKDEAAHIEAVRDRLLELTQVIDQTSQQAVEGAVNALREIITAHDIDAAIDERLNVIDDMFMQVLSTNIQHAESRNDTAVVSRLKYIFDRVMALLAQSAPPAVQFINEVLQMPTAQLRQQEMALRAGEFGPDLLTWFDTLLESVEVQAADSAMGEMLVELREVAARALQLDSQQGSDRATPAPTNTVKFEPRPAPPAPPPAPKADGRQGDTSSSGIVLPFSARKRKGD